MMVLSNKSPQFQSLRDQPAPLKKRDHISAWITASVRSDYFISSCASLLLIAGIIFFPTFREFSEFDISEEVLELIDAEVYAPPAAENTDISEEGTETATSEQKARTGMENALDMAYATDQISIPRLETRLQKLTPPLAKELNMEAVCNLEIHILSSGQVYRVKVLRISLTKIVPKDLEDRLKKEYSAAVLKIMNSARYTPTVVDGKPRPVIMEDTFKFELE